MQILIDIPDELRAGITAARDAYNASKPQTVQDGEIEVGRDLEDNPIMGPNMVPNPALIATDEAYLVWVVERAVASYQALLAVAPPPPPPPVVVIDGIPQSCTRKQGLKALARVQQFGLPAPITEQDLLTFIDAMPEDTPEQVQIKIDTRIEFTTAPTWNRTSPFVISLATALGMPPELVDALFVLANTFIG